MSALPRDDAIGALRRRFAWVAALLLLPLSLLVWRAVIGVEAEHLAHHETVARRLFDEMERALTEVLREEERRPYAHYRPLTAGRPSPLASARPWPFGVGWFEIGPDGAFDSPMRAAPALARVRDVVGRFDAGVRFPLEGLDDQAPGSTVVTNTAQRVISEGVLAQGKLSLSTLNRGTAAREGRAGRMEWVAPSAVAPDDTGDAIEQVSAGGSQARYADPTAGPDPGSVVDVRIEPMRGTLVDRSHLVLVRRVSSSAGVTRQGLVIDVAALGRWLLSHTVDGAAVAPYATVEISSDPTVSPAVLNAFAHRFAEPFEHLGATLVLRPLPDAVQTGWVIGLGVGLLVVGPLGLLALYRMTATRVRFARRRNDFVSAVTHELKTPLTSIRMYGEMLRDGMVPDPEKRQTYYGHITAEAERLSRLIDNVLELARLEKGGRAMSPVIGDPVAALRAVVEVFGPQARAAGFELVVEHAPDLPAVRIDRDALTQVVFNLVDNAVKYARDATDRRIVLRATAAPTPPGGVLLAVRDHGPGVPERQLRQVFEPFFRGQRELTRTARGTGIGLALVAGLVERMGGRVAARNAEGGGFEVRITLPAAG